MTGQRAHLILRQPARVCPGRRAYSHKLLQLFDPNRNLSLDPPEVIGLLVKCDQLWGRWWRSSAYWRRWWRRRRVGRPSNGAHAYIMRHRRFNLERWAWGKVRSYNLNFLIFKTCSQKAIRSVYTE
jgi:hypothetical protein